jgi:hypothetical protein
VTEWGVEQGGVIYSCIDARAAVRREGRCRAGGEQAWVVYSIDRGYTWRRLEASSPVRPDPAPPVGPRRVSVFDRLGRGKARWWARLAAAVGRKPDAFGRRRRE